MDYASVQNGLLLRTLWNNVSSKMDYYFFISVIAQALSALLHILFQDYYRRNCSAPSNRHPR